MSRIAMSDSPELVYFSSVSENTKRFVERLGIAEYLESQLGERFSPPQLMRDMVARGELGRKSGKGFYDYSE